MTARPEERDRLYGIAEESDAIRTDETRTDAIKPDAEEVDVTTEETDALTMPPVTSNDSRAPPPSARR